MNRTSLPRITEPDLFYACMRRDGCWHGFYRHGAAWSLYGEPDANAVLVRCRERVDGDPESTYWGWEYTPERDPDKGLGGAWSMIFHRYALLTMCFPYGIEAAQNAKDGRPVNLIVAPVHP